MRCWKNIAREISQLESSGFEEQQSQLSNNFQGVSSLSYRDNRPILQPVPQQMNREIKSADLHHRVMTQVEGLLDLNMIMHFFLDFQHHKGRLQLKKRSEDEVDYQLKMNLVLIQSRARNESPWWLQIQEFTSICI